MKEELKKIISGEVEDNESTLIKYSKDASIFKVKPKLVIFPRDSADIEKVVKFASENKKNDPNLSITARAGGSCMAGGPLNESIILDTTKYLVGIKSWANDSAVVMLGTMYKDFEIESLARDLLLPCFTASKNLNAIGGMIGNNSAGEKTLKYGQMDRYVKKLKMVFSDGVEREIRPLSVDELEQKKKQDDFEGKIYREVDELVESNKELIEIDRP